MGRGFPRAPTLKGLYPFLATDPNYNKRKAEADAAIKRVGEYRDKVRSALVKEIKESSRSERKKRRALRRIERKVTKALSNDPVAEQLRGLEEQGKKFLETDIGDETGKTAVLEYREAKKEAKEPR